MTINLSPLTIKQIHDCLDQKEITVLALVENYFKKIKASTHNAYLTLCESRAIDQAKNADALIELEGGKVPREKFPLLGIPFGIKDNIVIEGVRTTCASKVLENYIPPYTASCVERLERAGAIVLGKLNMDEFAMGCSTENSAFGSVLHPTHIDRVPGGSSGGASTAVAADLCVAALGSDTGGSVRLPASFCGVTGFRPTYGRVSRYGLIAFASSLDQVGPMTRSAADSALVFSVIGGQDSRDATSVSFSPIKKVMQKTVLKDWSQLSIGVPKEYGSYSGAPKIEKDVENAFRAALNFFEKKGSKIVEVDLPSTRHAVAAYYVLALCEGSSNLARFDGVRYGSQACTTAVENSVYKKSRSLFGPEVKRRILLGTFALSGGYYEAYYKKATLLRAQMKNEFGEAFRQVDFIVGPVAPFTAFKKGEKVTDPLQMYLTDSFTVPASLVGIPAISVPCGQDGLGLPIGLHIMAPAFKDELLLQFAHAFEQTAKEGR